VRFTKQNPLPRLRLNANLQSLSCKVSVHGLVDCLLLLRPSEATSPP
jgi:hypothetical protein